MMRRELSQAHPTHAPASGRTSELTRRELDVLRLIAAGRSTKEIAGELCISPKTVDHHVQHIYAKIGVSTRVAAAIYARERGLPLLHTTVANPRK